MERRLGAAVGVAEQDVRDRADGRGKGLEDPLSGRPVVGRFARAIGAGVERPSRRRRHSSSMAISSAFRADRNGPSPTGR